MIERLSDERPSDVLGSLPRSRPHRRSDKRPSPGPAQHPVSSARAANENGGPAGNNDTGAATKRAAPRRAAPKRTATRAATTRAASAPASRSAAASNAPATPSGAAPHQRRLRQPAQPAGVPPTPPRSGRPEPATGRDILGTAAQAAAELAEIGLSIGARTVRNLVSRLPRP
jgi:hypothetical protein